MTTSPESRAKEIVSRALAVDAAVNLGTDYLESLIATAIRDAGNEALERAERAILNEHSVANSAELNVGVLRASRAVKAIRLKKE